MVDKNERNIADLAKNSDATLKELKSLNNQMKQLTRGMDRMISALERMGTTLADAVSQLNNTNEEPDSNKENN